nr:hypothetical protein [Tanacetum cinerariifolium]
ELAEYINTPGWNRPAFYNNDDDDDEDCTIAITPDFLITNSLIMGDEHLDTILKKESDEFINMGDEHLNTIPVTKSDEVIKSSVEDLVPIPSKSEAKDHVEIVINSNDDISSNDGDSLHEENIEYVEASPHDSELISLEAAEIVIPEVEEIEDDNLREKLLNVYLLIANIKALKDNPTPSSELLTKSSSTSLNSFLEETNTFHNSLPEFENFYFDLGEISSGSTTTHSDTSLPDYEAFYFNDDHIREISSGSTTTHSDISLPGYDSFIFDFAHEGFVDELAHIISPPKYDHFYFKDLPDPGELMSVLNSGIRENLFTSPHDSEVVSLEVAEIVIPEDEEIEDDNLREKLLKVYLLIAEIEALKDNTTPSSEFLTKSSSTSPKSFLEETNTFHTSLPEFKNFCFDLEEISSGSTTTHSDISLSEYDSFIFDLSNDQFPPTDRSDFTHEEFADKLAHIISPPECDCFYFRNLPDPVEDDHSLFLAYVVWIFLAYLTYLLFLLIFTH